MSEISVLENNISFPFQEMFKVALGLSYCKFLLKIKAVLDVKYCDINSFWNT